MGEVVGHSTLEDVFHSWASGCRRSHGRGHDVLFHKRRKQRRGRVFRLVFADKSCYFASMIVPHWDSSIRLTPGEEFTLDSDGSHEWRAKTSSLRTARGTILA